MQSYDAKSCNALEKAYYTPMEAAIRWCNLVAQEVQILNAMQGEIIPPVGLFPQWPCLRVNAEKIMDAINNSGLRHGRDGKTVALGGIWALLVLASMIIFVLIKLKPEKDYSELALRTKSWWGMITIFTFAMLTSRTVSLWFLGFVSFLALKEFFSMIPTRRADRRVLFWAYLAIPIQYYWAAMEWYGMFIIFIPVYAFLFLPFRMVITQKTEGFLKAAGTIHWGLMTCVFSISHTAYLLVLPPLPANTAGGAGLLLYLAFLTQFNDVAQYVWGKLFGRHKVLPLVSPKKTWQGLLGGIFTTTIAAVLIAPYITPFDTLHAMCAGLLISIAGFVGDVTISAIKRDIGVKDTGTTIPGHGGIMDRIDSLTFTAPLFFHFAYYFYY